MLGTRPVQGVSMTKLSRLFSCRESRIWCRRYVGTVVCESIYYLLLKYLPDIGAPKIVYVAKTVDIYIQLESNSLTGRQGKIDPRLEGYLGDV